MMKTLLTYMVCIAVLLGFILFMTASALSSNSSLASNLSEMLATTPPELDTYITSGKNTPRGGEEWFFVGHDQANGKGAERSLLQFDLSEVKSGSRIDSATISLKLELITPNDAPMTVNMYRIIGDWNNENISWQEFEANYQVDRAVAATQIVGTEFIWYHWNVKPLVEAWLNDASHTSKFSVIFESNQSSGQHERGFWSKDCTNTRCVKPVLEIQSTPPTPIPTNTPTNTPVPTPTFTPTPYPVQISLSHRVLTATPVASADSAAPQIALADVKRGEHVVYTIRYSAKSKVNTVKIDNRMPINVTPVKVNDGGTNNNGLVTWSFPALAANASGTVSYEVVFQQSSNEVGIVTNPDPPTVGIGDAIIFNADVTVVPNLMYHWNFGDGNEAGGPIATKTHKYTKAGNYQVILTVSNPNCYIDATITVTVTNTIVDANRSLLPTEVEKSDENFSLPEGTDPSNLPRCTENLSIVNNGATITWTGLPTPVASNAIILNPATLLYLPVIRR